MKQTAAFTHAAALGKITVGETALVLFSIQINVEGTLLYKWRKTVDPDRQSNQARHKNHSAGEVDVDIYQLVVANKGYFKFNIRCGSDIWWIYG